MLYVGQILGESEDSLVQTFDMAVDPVEVTNPATYNFAAISISKENSMLRCLKCIRKNYF